MDSAIELIEAPLVRINTMEGAVEMPQHYRRGVFAVVSGYGKEHVPLDDVFMVVHVPSGQAFGDADQNAIWFDWPGGHEDALNIARALTPFADVGADVPFGAVFTWPAGVVDVVNTVLAQARTRVADRRHAAQKPGGG